MSLDSSEFTTAKSFILNSENGSEVRLVYDSSHGSEIEIRGTVGDEYMSEYAKIKTDEEKIYRVWSGTGIKGRETGDVVKERRAGSRKVGEFVVADVTGLQLTAGEVNE